MGIFAAIVPVVIIASQTKSATLAVILVGLRLPLIRLVRLTFSRLHLTLFPQRAIGSVIGFAGFAGGVGGILVADFAWSGATTRTHVSTSDVLSCGEWRTSQALLVVALPRPEARAR
jgi:nitrate/nitrite transporter NarK